jgi:AcrR family transcriptional regulator
MSQSTPPIPSSLADATSTRPVGEERRRQIIQEAIRCFADKGFRGTTVRELASRVGITEAALYRYFPSKEALYQAIIDEKIAAPDPVETVEAAARAGDDLAVFGGLARNFLANGDTDPSFLRILLYTGLEGHELSAPFFAQRIRRTREFVAGYIAQRIRDGAFRDMDPTLGARAFLGMIVDYLIVRQIFQQKDVYGEGHGPQQVADAFVSIFLDGIRRRDERSDV